MVSPTRLQDAFGELIYAVAIADGVVQEEEISTLKELLEDHPWAKEIMWSFDYEKTKGNKLMDSYEKALNTLKENGPHPDYNYLVEVLEKIAGANDGVNRTEGRIIHVFQKSLKAHFLEFLDENKLR